MFIHFPVPQRFVILDEEFPQTFVVINTCCLHHLGMNRDMSDTMIHEVIYLFVVLFSSQIKK